MMFSICELLGIPLATEKCGGPQTCLTFLGLEVDTVLGEVRIPKEKFRRLEALVEQWGETVLHKA